MTLRVRSGFRFGARNQYGPGDLVSFGSDAEEQAALTAFSDKLESVPASEDAELLAAPARPAPNVVGYTGQRGKKRAEK